MLLHTVFHLPVVTNLMKKVVHFALPVIPSDVTIVTTSEICFEPLLDYCTFSWINPPMIQSNSVDCADSFACNYNPAAAGFTECDYCLGCTDAGACNFDSEALYDDGSCTYTGCSGCTSSCSSNYDASATIDDGSCDYANCGGCTDSEADNYDAGASIDDGSCEFAGCTYPSACNYDASANVDDGSCSLLSPAELTSVSLVSGASTLTSTDGEISKHEWTFG